MMKAVVLAGLACFVQSTMRDLSCEVCQTLVYDSHKRVKAAPKGSQKGTKLSLLVMDVLNSACSQSTWKDYADKAQLDQGKMQQECPVILSAIEEKLEEGLERGEEAKLRASLCIKKEAKKIKKKKSKRAVQAQGYCDSLWDESDMPHLRESQASKNLREGREWLALKKEEEGVVALPSGIMYKVLASGNGSVHPSKEDQVSVHYSGTLTNGEEFDSSYGRGSPATFGVTQVIAGWTQLLQLMVRGDMWEAYIPGDLAYGEAGSHGKIGPNAVLIFQIELLGVVGKDEAPPPESEESEEQEPVVTSAGHEKTEI